jgi:hypothetical protein
VWLGETESGLAEKFGARLFHASQKRRVGVDDVAVACRTTLVSPCVGLWRIFSALLLWRLSLTSQETNEFILNLHSIVLAHGAFQIHSMDVVLLIVIFYGLGRKRKAGLLRHTGLPH